MDTGGMLSWERSLMSSIELVILPWFKVVVFYTEKQLTSIPFTEGVHIFGFVILNYKFYDLLINNKKITTMKTKRLQPLHILRLGMPG